MDERKALGDRGEAAVAAWLQARGFRLLERQFRCRYGEIDLIVRAPEGTVCFVEVKSRSSSRFAQAREFVTEGKRRRLRAAAAEYLAREGLGEETCRFDVAEVYPGRDGWGRPRIDYIIGAF